MMIVVKCQGKILKKLTDANRRELSKLTMGLLQSKLLTGPAASKFKMLRAPFKYRGVTTHKLFQDESKKRELVWPTVKNKFKLEITNYLPSPINVVSKPWNEEDSFKEMKKKKSPNKSLLLSGLLMSLGICSLSVGSKLIPQIMILWVLGFLATKERYMWLDVFLKTFRRDFDIMVKYIKIKWTMYSLKKKKFNLNKQFHQICQENPDKVALFYENQIWTYKMLNEHSNRVGNYFKSEGFKKGDTLAIMMENNVEFVLLWLGLSKIGVISALINTNIVNKALLHSIAVANCKGIIYSESLSNAVINLHQDLASLKHYQLDIERDELSPFVPHQNEVVDLKKALKESSTNDLVEHFENIKLSDQLQYVYTSGTTGLPKAAIISHNRYLLLASSINTMLEIREDDIIYNPLPLYHTSGNILGIGQALVYKTPCVIKKKFSASNFWTDCIKYNCTIACYIGEMCRYLLSVPEKPHDTQHNLRLMFGNGLKPLIWTKFVERFKVNKIGEFYGATEGIANLINIDNKVGSVGFVPRFFTYFYPLFLIKMDEETEKPLRNSDGLCILCKPDEPGLLIGKINQRNPMNAFAGYADKEQSESKILRNVFTLGDLYFNSGDILVMDNYGYFAFRDRIGDTYRWKGENISTSEVEGIISGIIKMEDAVVYGVEIPNTEGRAGMATIVDKEGVLNLEELARNMENSLPSYARPVFVRLIKNIETTGTFKLKKRELQNEGFDVELIKDDIYFFNQKKKQFELLTVPLYFEIMNGNIRL